MTINIEKTGNKQKGGWSRGKGTRLHNWERKCETKLLLFL